MTMSRSALPDIGPFLWTRLQRRAALHGRSPEVEAKAILEEALSTPGEDVWARVDEIHARLAASGRTFSDSAELVREDRDR